VNAVHRTEQTAPASAESAVPEKLIIKNHSGEGPFFAKWLRGAQLVAQIVFFIGCGAIVIAMEQLMKLFKASDGDGIPRSSGQPEIRNAQGHPERIKVPMLPIDNYNQLDSSQVIQRLTSLADEQLRIMQAFEACHKNRGDVLEAIDRHLAVNR
jgi:hypothetical protein